MQSQQQLLLEFIKKLFGKWILWIFFSLDAISLLIVYICPSLLLPQLVYWTIAFLGFLWASFQVYKEQQEAISNLSFDDSLEMDRARRNRERDIQIFERITTLLNSDNEIRYLREHDFGGEYDMERLENLYEFEELCKLPDFEFIDPELEKIKKDLASRVRNFNLFRAGEAYSVESKHSWASIPREYRITDPNRWRRLQRRFNALANDVVIVYDKLIRQARKKL